MFAKAKEPAKAKAAPTEKKKVSSGKLRALFGSLLDRNAVPNRLQPMRW